LSLNPLKFSTSFYQRSNCDFKIIFFDVLRFSCADKTQLHIGFFRLLRDRFSSIAETAFPFPVVSNQRKSRFEHIGSP
jgi:hypothetical protein